MRGSDITARIVDASDPADRRRSARIEVELDAKVRELGSEGTEARVVNISDTGFMAESSGDFEVGSRIWLILPGRDRASAIVRWTAGDRLGAEFSEAVSIDGIGSQG
ncbi:PilZ domain-containing protein [Sphingomonas sp.]|uniref:PilZ domain-containing protein n=1 Tax=Sphingomonas sp. TaxID=28214 RepID=UPI00286C5CE7|nr:PilZ domain-containing protein [Sphingomonas sp.]